MFAVSLLAALFPHVAASDMQDAGPFRLMAIAVCTVTGLMLADIYLFNGNMTESFFGLDGKEPADAVTVPA